MKIKLAHQLNGDIQIYDDEEDAPLITVQFHNEAKKIPWETKQCLVTQMVTAQAETCWPTLLFWVSVGWLFGFVVAIFVVRWSIGS